MMPVLLAHLKALWQKAYDARFQATDFPSRTLDGRKKATQKSPAGTATFGVALSALFILASAFVSLSFPASAHAAIAFGSISAVDNAISRTSVAVSGSNTVGIVVVTGNPIASADQMAPVTWGSQTMTLVDSTTTSPNGRWNYIFCVNNPVSAATITFTTNTDLNWRNFDFYYTGAVCPPVDSHNKNQAVGGTAISISTTVVTANSWLIMMQSDATGGETYSASGSLTTMRANTDAGGLAIADSNGGVTAGSKTGTLTGTGGNHGGVIFSLAPAPATFQLWPFASF